MRYIIIPLSVILYILWSYASIKDSRQKKSTISLSSFIYFLLHILLFSGCFAYYIVIPAFDFIKLNW